MFVDRVKIECIAGKGGNGVVAWRKEKYIPKGGPAGGNGGRGGSIHLQADHNVYSLDWFTYKRIIRAQDGGAGGSACRQGKNGEDLILKVPCGTLLKDPETQQVIHDFTQDGDSFKLCQGGKGGKGNHFFRSPTNQAPNIAKPGTEGETIVIELELKLIADIGIIGFPNAGKSRLLKELAAARVKIAPYPFTTLQPNLGYLYLDDGSKILLADIPGIIKGAHDNRGLGFEFLRHIERTKALLYVIDAAAVDGRDPEEDFTILRQELEAYEPALLQRPCLVVLNKCDLEEAEPHIKALRKALGKKHQLFVISAEQGIGIAELKEALRKLI